MLFHKRVPFHFSNCCQMSSWMNISRLPENKKKQTMSDKAVFTSWLIQLWQPSRQSVHNTYIYNVSNLLISAHQNVYTVHRLWHRSDVSYTNRSWLVLQCREDMLPSQCTQPVASVHVRADKRTQTHMELGSSKATFSSCLGCQEKLRMKTSLTP